MNDNRAGRPDLWATLEDGGYRRTRSRRRVVEALERKRDGFTTEEVCAELPDVGRATVYRTVRLLVEAGAICRLALPDGGSRYSLSRVEHHHHTLCIRCGAVGEFRNVAIERLLRAVGETMPGEIVGHRIELYMRCQECLVTVES